MNEKEKRSEEKLIGFENYDAYLQYIRTLIKMRPDEYAALYKVLLKLQSVGQKPMDILHQCKYRQGDADCLDMLKFMIYIDDLDLADLKEQL